MIKTFKIKYEIIKINYTNETKIIYIPVLPYIYFKSILCPTKFLFSLAFAYENIKNIMPKVNIL